MTNNHSDYHLKRIYAVLGVSRSGTSAIARGLRALNIDLGDKLLKGDARNPKGFWEDADILYRINRNVSNVLHYPWMTVGSFDHNLLENNAALKKYHQDAVMILQKRFQATQHWGFKDPRTVTLLPFWQSVFQTIQAEENYIIVVRNPLSAAYSQQKFINTPIEVGLLYWLIHLFSAIEGTHGKKRVVVSYESMLQNPRAELMRIYTMLKMETELQVSEIDDYIHHFLDATLDHHAMNPDELHHHPAISVVPLCLELYDLLCQLAKDQIKVESDFFREKWGVIQSLFKNAYPVYHFIHCLIKQNKSLQREMRTIHKSIPWKLSYPFRIIDHFLRKLRKNAKQQRRLMDVYE